MNPSIGIPSTLHPYSHAGEAVDIEVVRAFLSPQPLSLEQALAAVESDTGGAAVSFSGIVRNHDDGKPVSRLSYSAHPTANAAMNEVVRRVAADYANAGTRGKVKIWVGHRLGMLEIGDPALICAVSASHRAEAFQVCSDLVDRVKAQVPIWKEQFFRDGSVEWVGAAG